MNHANRVTGVSKEGVSNPGSHFRALAELDLNQEIDSNEEIPQDQAPNKETVINQEHRGKENRDHPNWAQDTANMDARHQSQDSTNGLGQAFGLRMVPSPHHLPQVNPQARPRINSPM